MTYRDYFRLHPAENLAWCRAYSTEDGEHMIVICDGQRPAIMDPDGLTCLEDMSEDEADAALESFARDVNPDFDAYEDHDALEIILDVMTPVGCASCPFYHYDCDAMSEEIDA